MGALPQFFSILFFTLTRPPCKTKIRTILHELKTTQEEEIYYLSEKIAEGILPAASPISVIESNVANIDVVSIGFSPVVSFMVYGESQ